MVNTTSNVAGIIQVLIELVPKTGCENCYLLMNYRIYSA
jgi:hypothetical protein